MDTNKVNENNGVSTIRDILMGGHIAEYAAHFKAVENSIEKNEEEFNDRLQVFDQKVNEHFNLLEKQVEERFAKLEALVDLQVKKLNKKIAKVSSADRSGLSMMLAEVSQRLIALEAEDDDDDDDDLLTE